MPVGMIEIDGIEGQIERVGELPVLFGLLKQMSIQSIIDRVIKPHGNWQGLTSGWVIVIWLMHVLSAQSHLMQPVQQRARQHLVLLRGLTKQDVTELNFTDGRLALCLLSLHRGYEESASRGVARRSTKADNRSMKPFPSRLADDAGTSVEAYTIPSLR